ncbi:MAG: class I SAM-dependent methyltransferase [Patescibacteria group bacterium]|nr:class I SAM-dependent methyltransferase [Patescibacteria group bacterium]
MDAKQFENERWNSKDQGLMFRHKTSMNFIEKGSVVDLGCGDGAFLDLLKKTGIIAEGADISERAVEKSISKGHKAVLLKQEDGGKLPFRDDQFDNAVLLDVLEHLHQPEKFLEEAARISKSVLIISTPNFNSLPARIQVLFGKEPENNKPNKGHVYWFNYDILKNLLIQHGLEIVIFRTNTFWEEKFLIGYVMRFLNKLFPKLLSLSFVLKARKLTNEN